MGGGGGLLLNSPGAVSHRVNHEPVILGEAVRRSLLPLHSLFYVLVDFIHSN